MGTTAAGGIRRDASGSALIATMSIWNHSHHIDDAGGRRFSYVPAEQWQQIADDLVHVADHLDGAVVRFIGTGVDPSVPRAAFLGGAVLDPAQASSVVCLVEAASDALDALRDAFSDFLVAHDLRAGWFVAAELGVVLQLGAATSP